MSISSPAKRAILYFDGGCRPNPGPLQTAVVCGEQAWIQADLGEGDNTDAEWLALLHAARLAAASGARDVLFLGDSALVIAQASGRQRARTPRLLRYVAQFHDTAGEFDRVVLRHVRRSKNLAGIALARGTWP